MMYLNSYAAVGGPGKNCCLHEDRAGLLCSEPPGSRGRLSECCPRVSKELNLDILRRASHRPMKRPKDRLGGRADEGIRLFCLKKERLKKRSNHVSQHLLEPALIHLEGGARNNRQKPRAGQISTPHELSELLEREGREGEPVSSLFKDT